MGDSLDSFAELSVLVTNVLRRMDMFRISLLFGVALLLLLALPFSKEAQAAETSISCTPVDVVTFQGRVHVRCAAPVAGIVFFAVSTQDSAFVARVLSVIATAQVAGRTLSIRYDPTDLSGAAIGCQNNDCRLILAVGFGQ
jgi:hypothetical protein